MKIDTIETWYLRELGNSYCYAQNDIFEWDDADRKINTILGIQHKIVESENMWILDYLHYSVLCAKFALDYKKQTGEDYKFTQEDEDKFELLMISWNAVLVLEKCCRGSQSSFSQKKAGDAKDRFGIQFSSLAEKFLKEMYPEVYKNLRIKKKDTIGFCKKNQTALSKATVVVKQPAKPKSKTK